MRAACLANRRAGSHVLRGPQFRDDATLCAEVPQSRMREIVWREIVWKASTQNHNLVIRRHREERSDEAIQRVRVSALDCFASLAMTRLHESPCSDSGYY